MQVRQHNTVEEFLDQVKEFGSQVVEEFRFAALAQDIAHTTIRRRVLGPASTEGLYVDILTVGHDLLGRELTGAEADDVHAAIVENLRVP